MLDYHVDSVRRLVVTRAIGHVTVTEVANHIIRLMCDPTFKPDLNAMIIAADVNAVPSAMEIAAIGPLVRAWSRRRVGAKWAFVLPNRATRDFVESVLAAARLPSVSTRCFTSEDAALEWLDPGQATLAAPGTKPAAAESALA